MIEGLTPFHEAGFALHWLRVRSKAPIADGWSVAPVATLADLRSDYVKGYNVGVRLGEPSRVGGGYLHALDVDIRDAALADEAHEALQTLLGDIDSASLPSVISGSGGASRHLYFITAKPFYSRKLAVSEGKHRGRDGKWHYDWEIELFGTGKQVAMPPSIHPDTLQPYRWERPFDFAGLALGMVPAIPDQRITEISDVTESTYEFETIEPLEFKTGQLERELEALPDDKIDDYHDWVMLGQALHHQFGGAERGYHLWVQASKRSEKFNEKEMPAKWRGFGRNRRRPVTMATIRSWYLEARSDSILDAFEDLPDAAEASGAAAAIDAPEPAAAVADLGLDPLDAPPAAKPVDPLDEKVETPWQSLLDYNIETGAIRPHLHNVTLIVKNDPRCAGVPALNLFTQEIVQRKPIGIQGKQRRSSAKEPMQLKAEIWRVKDETNGTLWNDSRDNDLRRVFEAPGTQGGYGIKITDRDLHAAVDIAAQQNAFHPIHEYLEGLSWDGKPRIERLLVDYLGAPDNAYTRDIARLFMVAAVTRVYEPGHKFDFAIIIEGIQGKRKSTFIKTLGRNWFAELDGDFHDQKQMIELMQGAWIMEIPELSGFNRGDVRTIKAFISRERDRARLAYARRAGEFARQCVFIGSTNDREYLKDDTGGRRFWPVYCTTGEINTDKLGRNVDQLWAEALRLYREMRETQPHGTLPLYITDEHSMQIAMRMQETRRVESVDDGMLGAIAHWLEQPIASGGFDGEDGKVRDQTCLLQIWCECLNGRKESYNNQQSQTIGRALSRIEGWAPTGERPVFKGYGRQREYKRVG